MLLSRCVAHFSDKYIIFPPHNTQNGRASEATCTTAEKQSSDEEYGDEEEELDFDQHVQKIKAYTGSLPAPGTPLGFDKTLRDDIATSPLTNASMSIGGLDLDEMMDGGMEDGSYPDQEMGMLGGINVEPVNFSSYKWGSHQYHDEQPQEPGCVSGFSNGNGFCGMGGMGAPNIAPVAFSASMAAFCDFNMGSSYDQDEYYPQEDNYDEAQPVLMCDVVEAVHRPQQQQHHFFSPSSVFCAPR